MDDRVSRRRGRPRLKPNSTTAPPAEEILGAAAAMFADVGYEQTSFTAIAEAVGMQRASLYHHFPNKEALLLEIGLLWLEPLGELLEEFDAEGGPCDLRLYRYLRIDLRHIQSAPYDLGRLYQLSGPPAPTGTDEANLLIDAIHDAWTRWISAAVASGAFRPLDPALAGSLVEAAYLGVITSERPAVLDDSGRTADGFADLILRGLLHDPGRLDELRTEAVDQDGANPVLTDRRRRCE